MFDPVLKHPFDFRFNVRYQMAQGDLRLPRQFGGLIGRSSAELEMVPYEVLEVEGGKHEQAELGGIPSSRGWLVAAEDYESLAQHERIWHYKDRADPVPHGMRSYVFFKVLEIQGHDILWYKPHLVDGFVMDQAPDLLFRKVPPALLMRLEMSLNHDEWTMELYSCLSGNLVMTMRYHRTEKVTWKGFFIGLRFQLLDKLVITGAQSFKVFFEMEEPKQMNALLFKPYKYDEVEPAGPLKATAKALANAKSIPKAKAKSNPKAKARNAVVKRPAGRK